MVRIAMVAIVAMTVGSACQAAETVTYSYDAKGRVVKVVHSGTANAGQQVVYVYDKANNRQQVTVTGAK